jgi:hypothetical protein
MCDAYGSSYGEASNWGVSTGKSCGYTISTGRSESTSMGTPIASTSFWGSSSHASALANARARQAARPLEKQLRELARRLTLAEFHALRTQLEDCCDEILLNGI